MNPDEPTQLKVAYIHHVSEGYGGATKSLIELIKSFPKGVLDPHVICPEGGIARHFVSADIRVHTISALSLLMSSHGLPLRGIRLLDLLRYLYSCLYARELSALIAKLQPDIIHLNERGLLLPALIAKSRGYTVVMHARNVADKRIKWIKKLSDFVLNKYVDTVIAIDESVNQSLPGVARKIVIYNPLDFVSLGINRETVNRSSIVRFTFLAGFIPYKGIWDFLTAAKILKEKGKSNIRFNLAGANTRPPEFYKSIKGQIANAIGFAPDLETPVKDFIFRNQLAETVNYWGFVKDIRSLLRNHTDVFVFPSHLNGLGRGVFEAGTYAIPSIVTLDDKIEDIVQDGVTGIICPERDPHALAMAMERFVDNPSLINEMGEAAMKKYREQFDSKNSALRVLDVYSEAIKRNK